MEIKIDKSDLGITPKHVRSLLQKLAQLQAMSGDTDFEVHLNFEAKDTNELSLTLIWKALLHCKDLPCKKMIRYKGGSARHFDERHFFDSLTDRPSSIFSSQVPINYETFDPVRPTRESTQNEEIFETLDNATLKIFKEGNPFHQQIRIQMIECIQNAFDHSNSAAGNKAGVVCTVNTHKSLEFCVVDMGQGIKESFVSNEALRDNYAPLSHAEAIEQATQKNTSCNPAAFPHKDYSSGNGGIGMYWLKEFVRNHIDGLAIIISDEGYYTTQYQGKQSKKVTLQQSWPGTLIYFRVALEQEKSPEYKKLTGEFVEEFDSTIL